MTSVQCYFRKNNHRGIGKNDKISWENVYEAKLCARSFAPHVSELILPNGYRKKEKNRLWQTREISEKRVQIFRGKIYIPDNFIAIINIDQ